VTRTADPKCLQSRKLDQAALAERGRALFQRHGTAQLRSLAGMVDTKAYASALAVAGERDAAAALARLARDEDVKTLMEIVQPARLAIVDNFMFENFDRYHLLKRRKFPPVSAFSDGNEALAEQDPTEDARRTGVRYIERHDTPELRRFVALSAVSQRAIRASFDPVKMRAAGPMEWFRGIDKDLAALCMKDN
jgi:cytochrome c551/c552